MTEFYKNLQNLCKNKNLSILALERELHLPKNTISSWRKTLPSCERALLVAHFFNVSVDYLLGNSDDPLSHKAHIEPTMVEFIEMINKLSLNSKTVKATQQILQALCYLADE